MEGREGRKEWMRDEKIGSESGEGREIGLEMEKKKKKKRTRKKY